MSDENEQVVVKLLQDWMDYRTGELIVISRGQAKLIKCEILDTWETFKNRAGMTQQPSKLRSIIVHPPIYECPYCGYTSKKPFPIEHYEAGSSGYRTYRCPNCGREMEE